ncbi:MAG: hypothetical protein KKF41_09615 [Actinobacteria bacterium]|nr:hypothetical protein [Actinomycetota bacterium]MBU1945258.1 hypothetical protein [Actinomycetota bacterium]MBU2687830.1 hypothetical protein [Actinomycetota bacterium]
MSWLAFIHALLGAVLITGLVVVIWQSLFPSGRSLRAIRSNAVAMAAVAVVIDVLGDIVYTAYRVKSATGPRSIILAGNSPWIHEILMEFKEHAAHFVPALLLVAIALVFVYDIRRKENGTARKAVAAVFALALLVTVTVLLMGAFINNAAPIR